MISLQLQAEYKGKDVDEHSYLTKILPVISLHISHALEAAVANRPNDPIRFIASFLACNEHDGARYDEPKVDVDEKRIFSQQFFAVKNLINNKSTIIRWMC